MMEFDGQGKGRSGMSVPPARYDEPHQYSMDMAGQASLLGHRRWPHEYGVCIVQYMGQPSWLYASGIVRRVGHGYKLTRRSLFWRDLSLHAGVASAPGIEALGKTVADPPARVNHLPFIAASGCLARRPSGLP